MSLKKLIVITIMGILVTGCKSMNNAIIEEEEDLGIGLSGGEESLQFNGRSYKRTFYDDFTGDDLDQARWERCPEWQRQDTGGYWSNESTYLKDDSLIIEAKRKDGTLYSGGIRSKGKFEQTRGLYKIRFKVEKASGLWYAFWLMTDKVNNLSGGAKNGGEIDIFEVLPNDKWQEEGKKTYLNSAVHWDGYNTHHKSHASMYFIDDSFYDKWHEVAFEWTEDYYKAYLDDSTEPFWDSTIDGAEAWGGIVQTRNYIKITSEFGTWGGPVDDDALPAKMYVDWVKVYKAE
ncbi:MAG: glycoside hydrolase family 16 protein [Treponema sp.]|nr:glycoside hydrolase family 16 protein [Treponema sp.]